MHPTKITNYEIKEILSLIKKNLKKSDKKQKLCQLCKEKLDEKSNEDQTTVKSSINVITQRNK